MPRSAPKQCARPGCREVGRGRYCPAHQQQVHRENNDKRADSDKWYGTARWQRLRNRKIQLSPFCARCNTKGFLTVAKVVDHIIPVKDGGDMWDMDNLQSLCRKCHDIKTGEDYKKRRG